jgi:hypothetical protein
MQTLKGQLLQDNRTLSTKGLQEKNRFSKKVKRAAKKVKKFFKKN